MIWVGKEGGGEGLFLHDCSACMEATWALAGLAVATESVLPHPALPTQLPMPSWDAICRLLLSRRVRALGGWLGALKPSHKLNPTHFQRLHVAPWQGCGFSFTKELWSLNSAAISSSLAQNEGSVLMNAGTSGEMLPPPVNSTFTE